MFLYQKNIYGAINPTTDMSDIVSDVFRNSQKLQ